jgi:hypothetical protein
VTVFASPHLQLPGDFGELVGSQELRHHATHLLPGSTVQREIDEPIAQRAGEQFEQ